MGENGSAVFGGWLMLPSPEIAEAVVRAGYDFVGVDSQHGAHDFRDILRLVQLIDVLGVPACVRVAPDELFRVGRLADFGVSSIVVAMCDTADLAERAVSLTRYQPRGIRSYGGQRYDMRPEAADLSSQGPDVYAMIETRLGVENLPEILSVPGIAGVHVGRGDLSLSYGIDFRAADGQAIMPVVASILETTKRHGLAAAIHVVDGGEAADFARMGFDQLLMSTDIALLRAAYARELGRARTSLGLPERDE